MSYYRHMPWQASVASCCSQFTCDLSFHRRRLRRSPAQQSVCRRTPETHEQQTTPKFGWTEATAREPRRFPWGFWNGLTAWTVLIVHAFGGGSEHRLFDIGGLANRYDFGFLLTLRRSSESSV